MAEEFEYFPDPVPDTNENPTWGDYGKSVVSSVTGGVLAPIAADVRYGSEGDTSATGKFTNEMSRILQRHLNLATDELDASRTEVARKRAEAMITSGEFWEHPVSATMLKATGMLGTLGAAAISGGPVGAALVTGALSTGSYLNEVDKAIDAAKDADLRKNTHYESLRSMGLSEEDARLGLKREIIKRRDVLNFAAGALAGAFGPAGKAAAGLAGKTAVGLAGKEAGLASRVGLGVLEGAGTEAVQSGIENYTTQQSMVEGSLQPSFDEDALANSVLEGGFLGGVFGGAVGAAVGGKGKAKAQEIKAKRAAEPPELPVTSEVKPEDVNQQPKGIGTGNQVPPVETPPVGDEQNHPTRSETQYPKAKGRGGKKSNEGVVAEVVDPGAPTTVEAAAVAEMQQRAQPQPEIPSVPEAAPTPPPLPQEAQPGVPPPLPVQATPPSVPEAGAPAAPVPSAQAQPAPASVAPDPTLASTAPVPVEVAPPAAVATPEPVKRVLPNISPEAQAIEAAGNEQLKANVKAATKAPKKEATGERHRSATEKAILAEREQHAKDTFTEHTNDYPEQTPTAREERDALAKKIGTMLEAAAARGLVDREALPKDVVERVTRPARKDAQGKKIDFGPYTPEEYRQVHMSVPKKVAGARGHVMYLREAMAIKKLLEKKSPLIAKDKERINKFLTAGRDFRAGSDELLYQDRKEGGERANRQDQGDVEKAPAGKVARAVEEIGAAASEDVMSPEDRVAAKEDEEVEIKANVKPEEFAKEVEAAPKAEVAPYKPTRAEIAHDKAVAERQAAAAARAAKKATTPKVDPKAAIEKIRAAAKAKSAPVAEKKPVIAAKPIEAKSDADVTRAGKKTNTEPSDAQKEAGNYAKGVVDWNGLKVAIENPRGSVRKGKAKIGGMIREWSVKMQDHYGYIKRSLGADGDQVDVFMGPNPKSELVFVIDQTDFNGKFDEHKAMLGYDSRAEAMTAYDRAFSDNRGFERMGNIEEMTVQEFKDWVHSDKPRKAKKVEPELADIESDLRTELPIKSRMTPGRTINSDYVKPAREVLDALDFSHLTGVPRGIADIARRHFKTMVGDVDVHVVSQTKMAELTGFTEDAFANLDQGTLGKAHLRQADGKTTVILRADQFTDPARTAHAVLHEVAHAWTMRALVEDPLLYKRVTRMMAETRSFLEDLPDIREKVKYALTDEREFIAEAFSNPEVQNILSQIPMSTDLSQTLGMHMNRSSVWDAVVGLVRGVIEKITGRIPEGHRMIEGVMRLSKDFDTHTNKIKARRILGVDTAVKPHNEFDQTADLVGGLQNSIKAFVDERIKGEGLQPQHGKPWNLRWRTVDDLARLANESWRGANPVRRVADLMEMTRVKAAGYLRQAEPIMERAVQLEKKYQGKVWDDFTTLVHDETMAQVHADRNLAGNSHLGKDVLGNYYAKELHAGLAARWAELPQDLKDFRAEALKAYADRQNTMSLGVMKNRILALLGVNDDALARRIHTGTTLDTDADLVGGKHALELIKEAGALAKLEGPYVPLIRRGEFVVIATHDVDAPKGAKTATRIEDNVYEFTDRNEVIAYEKQLARDGGGKPTVKSRWVDKNTGKTKFPDGTKVTKQDTDAEQRFTVTVQNKHVSMHESLIEAQRAGFELAKDKSIHVRGIEQRKFEYDGHSDLFSREFQHMVSRVRGSERFKALDPTAQAGVLSELHQAGLRSLGSTRIQSKRLPRTYVEGASKDFTRNMLEYMQSSSGYMAKLDTQPQLEKALKEMDATVADDNHKTASLARSMIAREIHQRVVNNDGYSEGGGWNEWTKRLMTLSFLDKLAGPSHNIINSLQPSMVTFPVLAARYGVGKSFDGLSRAYRDVSGFGIVKSGLKDTIKKIRDGSAKTTDLLGDIKKNLSAKERAMIDYLAERGSIDPDAGFEIDRLIKAREGVGGKIDTGLGRFESIARQMPQAIEMMNRAVSALATYRLEIARGATHESAMIKAQEVVNSTQGLYSASNAAPIFNHPVAKLALQFKKYGQMMYSLLGSNIGKAFRNANEGDRAEALKTLAGITATHVAMAGALGLPTEPFKYLLMSAQAAGLTSTGWGDVENAVRETATSWFGKTGGEVLTKGLPRLVGVDLSTRVGLDSISSFGEPKSNKDTDVKTWLFDTLAGAPAALIGDWIKGANNLMLGNFVKAGEQLVPLKFASDAIKAYRLSTEGKIGSTGKETMKPYNPLEAAVRVAGFTPAREAEEGAKRSAYYSAQKKYSGERQALMTEWVSAKPQHKFDAWKKIQSFNKGKSRDQQITMAELTSAASRRAKEGNAIKTTKRDKEYLDRATATYNTR